MVRRRSGHLRRRCGGRQAAVGAALLRHGLVRGDRVGLLAENSPWFIAAYLGAIRAGLCVVPLPTDCDAESFARYVASLGMRCVLVSPRIRPRVEAVAAKLGVTLIAEPPNGSPPTEDSAPAADVDPCVDLAAIMFTSGSTGEPKGVMVTHRNIECNTRDILDYLGLSPDDRTMTVLPFYYCYGTSLLHTHLMAGGVAGAEQPLHVSRKSARRDGARSNAPGLAGVPSTYQILLRKTRFAQRQFPVVALAATGGRKTAQSVHSRTPPGPARRQAVRDVRPDRGHGAAELSAARTAGRQARLDRPRAAAHAAGSAQGQTARRFAPARDEVGEIVASGENITLGYWNDAEETRPLFPRRQALHRRHGPRRCGRIHLHRRAGAGFHQGDGQPRQPQGNRGSDRPKCRRSSRRP